jgi:hypothetical protein
VSIKKYVSHSFQPLLFNKAPNISVVLSINISKKRLGCSKRKNKKIKERGQMS